MTRAGVRERPILFSGPMVRAILEGRKTQTRRVVTPQPMLVRKAGGQDCTGRFEFKSIRTAVTENPSWVNPAMYSECPYGKAGDLLWLRETWASFGSSASITPPVPLACQIRYHADNTCQWKPVPRDAKGLHHDASFRLHPSIHMPRWASRITLEITSVRVERVQEISASDIEREGAITTAVEINDVLPIWINLWDGINGKRGFGWAVNPWVWVIEFARVQP